MDRRLDHVGRVLGADHNVAELTRPGRRPGAVDREREHVRRLVETAVVAVELADPALADELHREMAVADPDGGEGRLDRRAQVDGDVVEVERQLELVRSAYSP